MTLLDIGPGTGGMSFPERDTYLRGMETEQTSSGWLDE